MSITFKFDAALTAKQTVVLNDKAKDCGITYDNILSLLNSYSLFTTLETDELTALHDGEIVVVGKIKTEICDNSEYFCFEEVIF